MYHKPVLLEASVDALSIQENGCYVDATFGGGGHSKYILSKLGPKGKLFAFDQDADALSNIWNDDRLVLIQQNFRHLKRYLKFYGVDKVDGILADFGVSSHQFDAPERGFSTRFDSRLDMRMNQSSDLDAEQVVNTYDEVALSRLFWDYGELRMARALAKSIVQKRVSKPLQNTGDLVDAVEKLIPEKHRHKILAQLFQAIRIEVNQELDVLRDFLMQCAEVIVEGGRLSAISYHSLEDRLVKRFIQNGCFDSEPVKDDFGIPQLLFKRVGSVVVPSVEEIKENNRARSAKLRVGERIE